MRAASGKNVTIESNSQTATDGEGFSQRLKLNGTGNADARSIHFSTSGEATVTVYALSGSSSADRSLTLSTLDGVTVGSVAAYGKTLEPGKIEVTEAGDYYLWSPSSGVNVYKIIVQEGDTSAEPIERLDWDIVSGPAITSVGLKSGDKNKIIVEYELVTGNDGADKSTVNMYDENGDLVDSVMKGKSASTDVSAEFTPASSGTYSFKVIAERNDETDKKESDVESFDFTLPLTKPYINAYTAELNSLLVEWNEVNEANSYTVEYKETGASSFTVSSTGITELSHMVTGLTAGTEYVLKVTAVRGGDSESSEISKVVSETVERNWKFASFGQSSNTSYNTYEILDNGKAIKLNSATYKADGTTDKKGGKFTSFHDGISFYYTEVDPAKENFVLTATFTVDYLNPTPDGQEGFGIIARDSIGEHGVSSDNFMTNSASILATKIEKTFDDGTKVTLKDGLGTRFTYGLTSELIAANSTVGAASEYDAFSWNEEDIIKQGDVYTLTLKKTNTGYHAILNNDESKEIIMYDNYSKALTAVDSEKIYVGLAVARGCNVTVTDMSFTTSDPATDPAAVPKPQVQVRPSYVVTSPTKTGNKNYEMVFSSNADGKLTIKDSRGRVLVNAGDVTASVDYKKPLVLLEGNNRYTVTFTPVEGYVTAKGEVLSSYTTSTQVFTVNHKVYITSNNTIYVTPTGRVSGNGTIERPLDIYTAVSYVMPGQTIVLKDGVYQMTSRLKVPRGISGTLEKKIVMASESGGRAILDFAGAGGNFELWGDYWHIYGIDVRNTDGNIKGMQIAGHNNIIELVNTYDNGDTGIQVSGTSAETIEKWPSNNLILNCTSYNNVDPGFNNADGFAAKLSTGEGNIFRGCIAYNNLDDGWDLFSKVESGPIGIVTIENSVAFKNGISFEGHTGDGNGFKLGGDGIAVKHVLENSISFKNRSNGITSNSDPAVILRNNTSAFNGGTGYSLYGKGTGELTFEAKNNISYQNTSSDDIKLATLFDDESNYFNGRNKNNVNITEDMFVSVDPSLVPMRKADGSIDLQGLLELTDLAPNGIGAVLGNTPGSNLNVNPAHDTSTDNDNDDDEDDRREDERREKERKEDLGDTTGTWIKDDKGWWYSKADKSYPENNWLKINGKWYHFNAKGYMNTGWQMVNNKWYLLNDNGDMATGWQLVNNKWYFLNANGDMVANTVIDGYRVDESGAWIEN